MKHLEEGTFFKCAERGRHFYCFRKTEIQWTVKLTRHEIYATQRQMIREGSSWTNNYPKPFTRWGVREGLHGTKMNWAFLAVLLGERELLKMKLKLIDTSPFIVLQRKSVLRENYWKQGVVWPPVAHCHQIRRLRRSPVRRSFLLDSLHRNHPSS